MKNHSLYRIGGPAAATLLRWCPFADVSRDQIEYLVQTHHLWKASCEAHLLGSDSEETRKLVRLEQAQLLVALSIDAMVMRFPVADKVPFVALGAFLKYLEERGNLEALRTMRRAGVDIYLHSMGITAGLAMELIAGMKLEETPGEIEIDLTNGKFSPIGKNPKAKQKLDRMRAEMARLPRKLPTLDQAAAAEMMAEIFNTPKDGEGYGDQTMPGSRVKAPDMIKMMQKDQFLAQVFTAMGGGIRAGERRGETLEEEGLKPIKMGFGSNILAASPIHLDGFMSDDEDRFCLELANISEGTLEVTKTARESMSSGHVICLVDASGSMSGEPFVYAKAAMGALALRALEESKNFTAMIFSSAGSIKRIPIVDKESFVKAIEFNYSGGTDFQSPLRAAVEEIVANKGKIAGSTDLIMITDGQCDVSREFTQWFLAQKAEHDIEFNGFFIGGVGDDLKQILDKSAEFKPGTGSIVEVMNSMRE